MPTPAPPAVPDRRLQTAVTRLAALHRGTFSAGTIQAVLVDSYNRLAEEATGPTLDTIVAEALTEDGIAAGEGFPKPITDDVIWAADVVITMGCGEACPVLPGKRYLDWPVPDPAGAGRREVYAVRDDLDIRT
jgi:arsenate reductase